MKLNRKLYPAISALLTLIIFLIVLASNSILGFDNNTILRSDLYGQFIDFIQLFLDSILSGDSLSYSFSLFMGSGTALTYAYYCLSPFNLLFLLPMSPAALAAIIITLKLMLSSITMNVYLQTKKVTPLASILFAVMYSCSTVCIAWHLNIMWLDAFYILPILILLIDKLLENGHYFSLTLVYAYLFLTNFYMGYIVGIFSLLYFVLNLFANNKSNSLSLKVILKNYIIAGLLSIGLVMIMLLPAFMFILEHPVPDSLPDSSVNTGLHHIINSLFMGQMPCLNNHVPLLYCGLITIPLVILFFYNKKASDKDKLIYPVTLGIYILAMICKPLYMFFHAFDVPDYYGYRFSIVIVFVLCTIAAKSFSFVKEYRLIDLVIIEALLLIFYSILISLPDCNCNTANGLFINLAFISIWLLLYYFRNHFKASVIITFVLLISIAELSSNGYLALRNEEHSAITEAKFNNNYYSEQYGINLIKSETDANDFYRINTDLEENYNAAAMHGYYSLCSFSSADLYKLRNALWHLGFVTSNKYLASTGLTDITKMLFSVKYTLSLTPSVYDEAKNYTSDSFNPVYYEANDTSLPLGFMVSGNILNYCPENNPFANQEALVNLMCDKAFSIYEPINKNDLIVYYDNMAIAQTGNYYSFYNLSDYYSGGRIEYSISGVSANDRAYAAFTMPFPTDDPFAPRIEACISGMYEQPALSTGCIVEAYPADNNTKKLSLVFDKDNCDYYCENMLFYKYAPSIANEVYSELSTNELELTEFSSNHIVGTVNATSNKPLLFTSIPYDKCWNVKIDGVVMKTIPVVEEAFLSVPVPEGIHEIEFTYTPSGYELGKAISLTCLIIYIAIVLINLVQKKKPSTSRS